MPSTIPNDPLPDPLRLHIGGKEVKEGWKILNIQAGPGVDYVGSCTDLGRFPDECCDEIYASHVLEHVPHNKGVVLTLREWRRVLKPGGIARISVPDLDTLCWLFVHPRLDPKARHHIMNMMYGGQRDAHDFHLVGLNWAILAQYLEQAGFREARQVKFFSLFNDTSSFTPYFGIPISLNVEAIK
ncbi:MAG: methyltransferase domain-containing protein [Magnetococcales bacterium]|nr:methyltransferase domain-containing protein [Magnetococcales bacterium]